LKSPIRIPKGFTLQISAILLIANPRHRSYIRRAAVFCGYCP